MVSLRYSNSGVCGSRKGSCHGDTGYTGEMAAEIQAAQASMNAMVRSTPREDLEKLAD